MSLRARWLQFKKQSWDSRSAQDRRILTVLAVVLAPLIAYVLLWQPAHTGVARLETSLPLMRFQADWMRRQAEQVDMLQQRAKPSLLNPSEMKTAVERSAEAYQLRSAIESMEGIEPDGLRIAFSAVPYARWLEWARHLQQDQHIRIDTLDVVALHTEGMVKINATLVNGSGQ